VSTHPAWSSPGDDLEPNPTHQAMRLYHRTSAANTILTRGFKDSSDAYRMNSCYRGVWVSDSPVDAHDATDGDEVLVIEIPESAIAEYEWVEEGVDYREWIVPAELLNRLGVVEMMKD